MAETTHPAGSFAHKLIMLDCALTRKTYQQASRTFRNSSNKTVEEFPYRGEYYLSDGGYSRLCWGWGTQSLFLSGNSRQEVKDQWRHCKELIADVEEEIRRAIDSEVR